MRSGACGRSRFPPTCRSARFSSACRSCSTSGDRAAGRRRRRSAASRDAAARGPPVTALLLAVALDVLLGEPPNRLHPVAWIGRVVGFAARLAPAGVVAGGRGGPIEAGTIRRAWVLVLAGG